MARGPFYGQVTPERAAQMAQHLSPADREVLRLLTVGSEPIRATASARSEDADHDPAFDRLYPPRTAAEATRRAAEDEQISAGRGTWSEDDVYDALWPKGLR